MSENIFDALDTADYICIMPESPSVCYGPMSAEAAMTFCETEEAFLRSRNLPGKWKAVPLLTP